jgi:hypothetical protein
VKDWTGIEIAEEHGRLEREAATILGFMHFEYARLEMELGLFLAWEGEGRKLDQFTAAVSDLNFKKKLERLEKSAHSRYADRPLALDAYKIWLAEANRIRALRNRFFHGRWGIGAVKQKVINVVGLPTSPEQSAVGYTIAELQSELESIIKLRSELASVRKSWPV